MNNKFSKRFKELRLERNLTQLEMGKIFGLSGSAVLKWERGFEPNFDTLMKIAKFFNVTVDYLLGITDY